MEGFELMKQGAEAKLYCGTYLGKPAVIKERFVKKYRQPELDTQITHSRIKAESRIIARCRSVGIITPTLYLVDFDRRLIIMEHYVNSITAKELIFKTSDETILNKLAKDIGCVVGRLHKNNLIHGDLTTSNILFVKRDAEKDFSNYDNLEIALIDFGLAYQEASHEDKGVDLYVLERALISTHSIAHKFFPAIMDAYGEENAKENSQVLKKFEEVRARGRKRTMVG